MSEEQIRSYIIDKDSYDKNILVEAGAAVIFAAAFAKVIPMLRKKFG